MPEMACDRCKEIFRYDRNDDRPYIYHECPDGILFGHKNSKPKRRPPLLHKKKTVWQTFADKPDSNLDKYKDEDIERWV